MKKIIGFIICTLLITSTGFSVLGINENIEILKIENSQPLTGLFEWPMFRYDLNNTGFSHYLAPDDDNVLWCKNIGMRIDSNPTVKDELLYIVGYEGGIDVYLLCLNPFTGEEIWKSYVDSQVWGSPTVANGRVYVLGISNDCYCYDAYTGGLIWTVYPHGHCSPMVFDDKVYIGSYGGGFYCLNATTGDEIWIHDLFTDYDGCTPAIVNGMVYIGNDEGTFYCLDADTGDEIWKYTTGANIWASPSVYSNKVYVASDKLYCLNSNTGEEKWIKDFELDYTHCSPAVAYGNVYIGEGHISPEGGGKIYCYDADNGDWIWTSPLLGASIWNAVAVADEKVYTCSNNLDDGIGKLNCLDAYTGDIIWQFDFISSRYSFSSPAVAYGNVYVGDGEHGSIYAFGTPNESPNTPAKLDGPDNGIPDVEYMFNCSTTDSEGDDIYYLFDWGDGNFSGWIGPYPSGTKVDASHMWTEFGDYEIRVRAHDRRRESDWSDALIIRIRSQPPDVPAINGPTSGNAGSTYTFTFNSVDPDGDDVYYYIKWDDGYLVNWDGPHASGTDFDIEHTYANKGIKTISAKAKDIYGAESNWSEFEVTIPRTKTTVYSLFHWFLERFPLLERLLNLLW